MSVTIDATASAAGGGFLEFATANVSDPLMPPTTDAIQSIEFVEVPEPATTVLAFLAMVGVAAGWRLRLAVAANCLRLRCTNFVALNTLIATI